MCDSPPNAIFTLYFHIFGLKRKPNFCGKACLVRGTLELNGVTVRGSALSLGGWQFKWRLEVQIWEVGSSNPG